MNIVAKLGYMTLVAITLAGILILTALASAPSALSLAPAAVALASNDSQSPKRNSPSIEVIRLANGTDMAYGDGFVPFEAVTLYAAPRSDAAFVEYAFWRSVNADNLGRFQTQITDFLPIVLATRCLVARGALSGFTSAIAYAPPAATPTPTPLPTATPIPSTPMPAAPIPTLAPTVDISPTERWLTQYYPNRDLLEPLALARNEDVINMNWGKNEPMFLGNPGVLPRNNFSARWRGKFNFPATENYLFIIQADDGVRLKIDGNVIINDWRAGPYRALQKDWPLSAGMHDVELEYFDQYGNAQVALNWLVGYSHWEGRYYKNTQFSGQVFAKRNDGQESGPLDFDWGDGEPFPGVGIDNFSVIWQRKVNFKTSGQYKFIVDRDDFMRVFIDGLEVHRSGIGGPGEFVYPVKRGGHFIEVHFVEYGGQAKLRFRWELIPPTPVPLPEPTPVFP